MIDSVLASIIGGATLMVVVVAVVGAVLVRASRKRKTSCPEAGDATEKWLNLPPLAGRSNSDITKLTIQPKAEKHRTFLSTMFKRKKPDIVIDSPPKEQPDEYLGKLNFGLAYDKDSNTLAIHVIQGADLPAMDITGSSDPYVRCCLLPDTQIVKVTRIHKRNLSPNFNQTVIFTVRGGMEGMLRHYAMHSVFHPVDQSDARRRHRSNGTPASQRANHHPGRFHSGHSRERHDDHIESCSPSPRKLRRRNSSPSSAGYTLKKLQEMSLCMQVLDYDRFTRDDPIGEIILPLKSVKFENCPVYWKNLQEVTVHKEAKGELMISLCYLPQSNKLTCVVVKAKDLPPKDISGSSDPYVKLWLVQGGNKIEKKKTTVKSQTLAPVYNESFTFLVAPDKIDEVQLVVTVVDYDLITSNDQIGSVVLGAKGSESGQKHWGEMLSRPGYPSALWHSLTPKW